MANDLTSSIWRTKEVKTRTQAIIDKICGIPIAGLPGAGHGAQPGHGSEMALNVFIMIKLYRLIVIIS